MTAPLLIYVFIGALTTIGYAIALATVHIDGNEDPVEMSMSLIMAGIMSIAFGAIWPISLPAGYIVLRRLQ